MTSMTQGLRAFSLPIVLSVAIHAVLLVLVAWGWDASNEHKPRVYRPQHIEAKLVQMEARDTAPQVQADPERQVIDLTRQRELQRAEEERRQREAEAQRRQQREREQKAEAEAERKREAERRRQEEERRRAEAERQRQEAERQRREEQERQRRIEEAQAQEEARQAAELAASQTQSYMAMMRERIERNWSRPPSARRGMTAELLINLVPTGQVVNVTVVRSSGDAAFDRAAEQAVRRVDRFTELQGMPAELFERNFRQVKLIFSPEDLRL